eukprot:4641167-Ditylum_brightwellii.AAC.1
MSGSIDFFFNLKSLPSTTHHTVALVDGNTNLPVTGIGTMDFKLGGYVIAIHNSLFVRGLADTLCSALDFAVPCIIGTGDITVFGSPPSDEEIFTSDFTYIASYKIPASDATWVHLSPTPLPSLNAQTEPLSPELMSIMHSPSLHICPEPKQPPAHASPFITADNPQQNEHNVASLDDSVATSTSTSN